MSIKQRTLIKSSILITICVGGVLAGLRPAMAQDAEEGVKPSAQWTLDTAMKHLEMYPNDTYLQYVTMQLAKREGVEQEFAKKIASTLNSSNPEWRRRADGVNLFSLFTGTLAIQESLQLEAMADGPVNARNGRRNLPSGNADVTQQNVLVSTLQGPTTKSHPWKEMLGNQPRKTSPLASYIPEDQYYIRFQSVSKLLEVLALSDQWGAHLMSQSNRKAYASNVDEELLTQLALDTNDLLKPFYDLVVKEIAATGNDLYLTRGSDITLLFRYQQPVVFKAQLDTFLAKAAKAHDKAVRDQGTYKGIKYESLTSPDRKVNVYSVFVGEDLHLRSNSLVGLKRVIDTFQGEPKTRRASLADSDEFAYIRTLMPLGAKEEDGLIYLSDPFIRRLTGPELKLTERRRVLCYNHLRMLSHACALYESEQGASPQSIEDLIEKKALPVDFGKTKLACPSGGTYKLSEDGRTGICSHHGRIGSLKPCCEIAVEKVSDEEARLYKEFVTAYERYWRTFFDPIAIRVSVQPEEYRMETIILPLINNSIYQGMAATLGGKTTPLETAPVPKRNIFSMSFQIDKQGLLQKSGWQPPVPDQQADAQSPEYLFEVSTQRMQQIGIAMHNYHDAHKSFPPVASTDAEGHQLLSWRVHLLPYLNQNELYQQFHLDEPWSSPHNRKLIGKIPNIYAITGEKKAEGRTSYQVVVGEQTLFTGGKNGVKIRETTDGTSNTVLFVDSNVADAVIWTRPDDVKASDKRLTEIILGKYNQKSLIAMADGSIRSVNNGLEKQTLEHAITRNGGEVLQNFGTRTNLRNRNRSGFVYWLTHVRDGQVDKKLAYDFVTKGIKNQIGFHVYDSEQTFDFQLTRFLGQMLGSFSNRNNFNDDFIPVFMLVASLNSPVYVSLPLEDVEVTDRFLDHLDDLLAPVARKTVSTGWFRTENDFYKIPVGENVLARTECISLGPIKWRFFWARIENQLYIASKPEVLHDLAKLHAEGVRGSNDPASSAHAMIRIRPENWNQTLSNFQLGWAENHRQACLDNVGRLSSLKNAVVAKQGTNLIEQRAEQLYGLDFYCPCGGKYHQHGEHLECSVHGSAYSPKQAAIGQEKGAIQNVLSSFGGLTVGLKFLEDGLHATLTVKRKK